VTAIAAILWPGRTAYLAVELIGLWAIAIGVLELSFAKYSGEDAKDRALLIIAAIALIVIGVGVMVRPFAGAVVVGAMVGIAALARGVSLIMSGISERFHQFGRTRQSDDVLPESAELPALSTPLRGTSCSRLTIEWGM
jgi:uncharacterized membrane protein HdeD (DUF308 family)